MADTSELLRLCDEILHSRDLYQTNPEAWCQAETVARALKSLLAEAPEDACPSCGDTRAEYERNGCGGIDGAPDQKFTGCKMPRRTSQAEAQAPAVLTEDERASIERAKLYGRAGATSNQLMWELLAIIDRLFPPSTPGNVRTMPTPGYPCSKCNRPVNRTLWGTCVECQRIAKGDAPVNV